VKNGSEMLYAMANTAFNQFRAGFVSQRQLAKRKILGVVGGLLHGPETLRIPRDSIPTYLLSETAYWATLAFKAAAFLPSSPSIT
jgi:hypothetical protein